MRILQLDPKAVRSGTVISEILRPMELPLKVCCANQKYPTPLQCKQTAHVETEHLNDQRVFFMYDFFENLIK